MYYTEFIQNGLDWTLLDIYICIFDFKLQYIGQILIGLTAIAVTINKSCCACGLLYSNRVITCQGKKITLCLEAHESTVWYLKMDYAGYVWLFGNVFLWRGSQRSSACALSGILESQIGFIRCGINMKPTNTNEWLLDWSFTTRLQHFLLVQKKAGQTCGIQPASLDFARFHTRLYCSNQTYLWCSVFGWILCV